MATGLNCLYADVDEFIYNVYKRRNLAPCLAALILTKPNISTISDHSLSLMFPGVSIYIMDTILLKNLI